jgi:protein involved in polysaccharide export with SLBB domain
MAQRLVRARRPARAIDSTTEGSMRPGKEAPMRCDKIALTRVNRQPDQRTNRLMLPVWCGAICAVGCNGPRIDEMRYFLRAHENTVSGVEYRLAPPDAILISSAQAPEVDGEVQTIRSDGKVSLRLLGEVKVAGLTTQEAADKLESLLARYYFKPAVNIRVAAHRSKYVYVFGQVQGVGAQAYSGRDTLLHVLSRAQPNFIAWLEQVKVVRPSPNGDAREVVVDVKKLMRDGDTSRNILLQEGDIVYVPPTPLGWAGLRLREILFPVTPLARTITAPAGIKASADVYDDWNDDDSDGTTAASVGLLP